MTRKSKREIERAIEDITDIDDVPGPDRIVIRDTVVGTAHDCSDFAEGKTETTERVIEL